LPCPLLDPSSRLFRTILTSYEFLPQLDTTSAAAAYAILIIGELIVTDRLGSNPSLDLSSLSGTEHLPLRLFAYLDVFRSIAQNDRPTLFTFTSPALPAFDTSDVSANLTTYTGFPLQLLPCLAAASNLSVRAREEPPTVSKAELEATAAQIEQEIRQWKAIPLNLEEGGEDSMMVIADVATKEMVRSQFYSSSLPTN
jgi:hypothetical protein